MTENRENYSQRTDEELMEAYLEGDSQAFDALYDRSADKLYGYLQRRLQARELIDDVFQSTWAKFHHTRGQYRAPLPVMPWLFTICRTVMIDHLRQLEKRRENLEEDMELFSKESPSNFGERSVSLAPTPLEALSGMKKLPDAQKEALSLRFEQELSFEEIAARISTTPANARQLVSRGVRRLKSFLEKKGGTK